MKYAIVVNGIIENVIESEARYAAAIGALPLPEGKWIGDRYDSEPEPGDDYISDSDALALLFGGA